MYDHSRDNERVIPSIPGQRKPSEPTTRRPQVPQQRDRRAS